MRKLSVILASVLTLSLPTIGSAQEPTAAAHATKLAALIEAVGGAEAKKAAEALAAATTIEDARKHFGDLSTIVVPVFQAAAIPGTNAYMCAMKKKRWIQKGDKVENPYYGKSMLRCGSPLPPKRK